MEVDTVHREANVKISIRFCMSSTDARKECTNIIKGYQENVLNELTFNFEEK